MPDKLFQSSRLKVERAKSHINELESIIREYVASDFYRLVQHIDPDTGRIKISFEISRDLPTSLNMAFGDVIQNLRSALDHIAYAVVDESGGNPIEAKFPFHETRKNLEDLVKKGQIARVGPEIADLILNTIKPYKTGNYALWSLNKLNIIDKHRMLISIAAFRGVTCSMRVGTNLFTNCNFSTGLGDDFVILDAAGDVEFTDEPRGTFNVEIGETDLLKGSPLVETLYQLSDIVLSIIDAFDATYVRHI